jgi:hypothetical protein
LENWRGYSLAKRGKTRSRQRDKWHKKDAESLGEAEKMVEAVGQAREQEVGKGTWNAGIRRNTSTKVSKDG